MSDSHIVQDFLVESYENLDRLDRELVGLQTRASVLYSVVIGGRVTELPDIPAILRSVDSNPARQNPVARSAEAAN